MSMFPADEHRRLRNERRKREQHWGTIIERSSPGTGDLWADLGCGNGYLSLPLSLDNRVIAIDGQMKMILALMERATPAQRAHLDPVVAFLPDIPLQDGVLDRIMMVNVLHEIDDRQRLASEVLRVLRPGGRMTLVDFRPDGSDDIGPPLEERVSVEEAISTFGAMTVLGNWIEPAFYQIELLKPLPGSVSRIP